MSLNLALTRNYLGNLMPLSPIATNGVSGTAPGQTLSGKRGVSNGITSDGGASTLISGDSGDTFYVIDPHDVVVAAAGSGINTVVSWTSSYTLPANVQNLFVQSGSGGIGVGNGLDNLLVAEGTAKYTLVGGAGNDVLIGNGSGDPQFDTGAGSTTFVIANGDGDDVIANFRSGIDLVRLNNFTNLSGFAAVQAAMTQVGSDVVLNLGGGQTLTFRSTTIAGFKPTDFMLPAYLPNMSLRFDDEFNSFVSSPDGSKGWMTTGGAGWRTLSGNNELEYYSDPSVGANPFSDTNGVLNITAAPGSNPLGLPYNSGIITTEHSLNFEYGLVEVSAKLPAGDGMWPAVWLLPSSLGWPPEIDIMEMLGSDPTTIYASTHSRPTNVSSTARVYVGDTTQAFHTYGLDWEPTTITWYFDGNAIATAATPSDMHQPMYLLINLAVGGAGSWPGAPTSAAEFPAQMSIDSVRVYASSATTALSGTALLPAQAPVTIVGATPDTGGTATAPAVVAVATSPGSGSVTVGGAVTLTVTFSTAVTVAGGTPTLTLNDGGTATYKSGSGTNALMFSYTVAAGQSTADLALAAANALALNGATIRDAAGNNAVLTAANGYNPAGTLLVDPGVPLVSSIVTSPGNGSLTTGGAVSLTVTFSEAVTVAGGIPTLALSDGGTATYKSGSGTNALVFGYTVAAGQSTADLALAATNALALNGATIRDAAGNNAVLTAANGYNPAGSLSVNLPAVQVISPGAGSFSDAAGNVYTIDAAGNALENGTLIPNGDSTGAMEYANGIVYGEYLTTGTWYEWTQTTWVGPVTPPPTTPPPPVDTTPPAIATTATSPGSGSLTTGGAVTLTVTFSEAVTVAGGTPTLALNDGGTATYKSGSGTNALVFGYTVAAGQSTADLALAATNALALNGATIRDAAGNNAVLTAANGYNPAGTLQVDTSAPAVSSIVTSPGSGSLTTGGAVSLTVTFSEAVTVAGGTPTLALNDGGTATHKSGSGTNALVFGYTVAAGQSTADLALAATNALALNGATIRDAAGNNAVLTAANSYNPAGTLQVDASAPALSSIVTSPGSGSLTTGGTVSLTVTFSEAVTVAGGTPTLALNDGGSATYKSGSGTAALVFSYTVAAGQSTADLALSATNAIALNGATIRDAAGNNAVLTSANGYNPAGTLQVGTQVVTPTPLAVSGWWNTYQPGSGTFNVSGTASGATVTLGNGNQIVNIVGASNIIKTGVGNDSITLNGDSNTVTTGSGRSTIKITGNYSAVTVGGTPSGTTSITASGYGETITSTAAGNVSVSGPTGASAVTLANGNDTITLGGSGNKVTVGVGTTTINAGTGQAIVHAGGGADTITVGGWNNLLDAGPGMNFLHGGSGNDTFVLNGAGQGLDTITGFALTNSDVLDLTRALAGSATKVDLTNIGNFVTATVAGGNTTLWVDLTGGHGSATAFAALDGVTSDVAALAAAHVLKLS